MVVHFIFPVEIVIPFESNEHVEIDIVLPLLKLIVVVSAIVNCLVIVISPLIVKLPPVDVNVSTFNELVDVVKLEAAFIVNVLHFIFEPFIVTVLSLKLHVDIVVVLVPNDNVVCVCDNVNMSVIS